MKILKRKTLAALLALSLLASLLPLGAQPAQAAAPNGQVIYVGNVDVTSGGYLTTGNDGTVTAFTGEGAPTDNYIHYDAEDNTLTLHNATIKESVPSTYVVGAAIGVANLSGNAELSIQLEGSNTIAEVSKGIYVLAHSNSTGDASLTITGDGSLNTNGSQNGIRVQSNGGDATLSIENAKVTATASSSGGGVLVQAKNDSDVSLTVDGGNLTASGNTGISFWFGTGYSGSGTPSLTVSGNAIVRASGGISDDSSADIQIGADSNGNNGGIVFDDGEGTVYGSVELQEDLEIGEGESLTIPDGSSLTIPDGKTLTNSGTVTTTGSGSLNNSGTINNSGTLPENVSGNQPPRITATTLLNGTVNTAYSQTLTAAGDATITWSLENGSTLPDGLTLDSSTGAITGTPTTAGTSTFTVKAQNSYGSDSKQLSITINAAAETVSVTGVTLNQNTLSLIEGESEQLTATVKPDNATNKNVTWSSSAGSVATVDANGKVTAVGAGVAQIIVTTADGGFTAVCVVSVEAPYTPPYIPPAKTPSQQAIDKIEDAKDGSTVKITLRAGNTELDKEVFEALQGRNVTLEISLPGGARWTVNGADIPQGAELCDLDLGVSMDTDGIPVDVINAVAGELSSVQITLAHNGDFGFTLTLTAPLGEENAGYWANLYHYDESAETLNFEAAAKIDEEGSVSIPFSHASQYAIVIDDHSHARVAVSDIFVDVAPDAWYTAAIQYAYDNGLMTGVSDTEFAPNATTTRAMIVSILARLENVTSAESAGFTDVTDEWYATAVNWAASENIVAGFEDGTFRPNDPITREQLAAILMNYAAYKGEDVSARITLDDYSDTSAISSWANDVMSWAVAEGLISGVTNDQLQPQASATRAQLAAILERFLGND